MLLLCLPFVAAALPIGRLPEVSDFCSFQWNATLKEAKQRVASSEAYIRQKKHEAARWSETDERRRLLGNRRQRQWRGLRRRAQQRRGAAERESGSRMSVRGMKRPPPGIRVTGGNLLLFLDPYQPEIWCDSERVGSYEDDFRGFSDGGKWICGVHSIEQPCLVYSIGSDNDFRFEKSIKGLTGCEVHTFDPTLSEGEFKGGQFSTFHSLGECQSLGFSHPLESNPLYLIH